MFLSCLADKPLPAEMNSQWVRQSAREHNVAHSKLKEMVVRYTKRRKPSTVAAIEAPHPGTYNKNEYNFTEVSPG